MTETPGPVRATELTGGERDELYERQAALYPRFR